MSNRYISLLRKLHYKSASAASCIARKPATNLAFQVNVDRSSVALERSLHSSTCLWKKNKRPEVVGVVSYKVVNKAVFINKLFCTIF